MPRALHRLAIISACIGTATLVALNCRLALRSHRASMPAVTVTAPHEVAPERISVSYDYAPTPLIASYPVLHKEIRLPYQEPWPGAILLSCDFNGTKWSGVWDTGSPQTYIPDSLGIRGRIQPGLSPKIVDISGRTAPGRVLVLPYLVLSAYAIRNAPVEVVKGAPGLRPGARLVVKTFEVGRYFAILGNPLLAGSAVTIDARHHELVLHETTYDVSRVPQNAGSLLLDFDWKGYLELRGKIYGHPARIIFDTGNTSQSIAISSDFAHRYLRGRHGRRSATSGGLFPSSAEEIGDLDWSVGGLKRKTPGSIIFQAGRDASVGPSLFKEYEITVDYPHRKLLLVPLTKRAPGG